MRIGVLHVNTSGANATSPTMRIARFVATELGAPLMHNPETAQRHMRYPFDLLFCKYGLLKFSQHRDEARQILDRAKYVVDLENDYAFVRDPRCRAPNEVWSTVPKAQPKGTLATEKRRYVNWNMLTWLPIETWTKGPRVVKPQYQGLIYWGAHRPGRGIYFQKYFGNARYPVTISTWRGRTNFRATCGSRVQIVGAFRDPIEPARYQMTLFLEDVISHTLYCSPANRFYEALQLGLPQAISVEAAGTLEQAGLRTDPWVVHNQRDIAAMLAKAPKLYDAQYKAWWKDYGAILRSQLARAMRLSFGAHWQR